MRSQLKVAAKRSFRDTGPVTRQNGGLFQCVGKSCLQLAGESPVVEGVANITT